MSGRLRRYALRALLFCATLALCALLLRHIDIDKLRATLLTADWRLLLLAAALNLCFNTAARTERWRALLLPLPPGPGQAPVGFLELGRLYLASLAGNNILPARAGEALRTYVLHRGHGYATSGLVAAQLFEKLLEALSLALQALVVLALVGGRLPAALRVPLVLYAAAVAVLAVLVAVLSHRDRGEEEAAPAEEAAAWQRAWAAARGGVRRLLRAVRQMHDPRVLARGFICSVISDLIDMLMVGLCLRAVGVALPVTAWMTLFVLLNLAIAVPLTPGQLGAMEAGAVLVLKLQGVDPHLGLAFALLYHAVHLIPVTAVGLALIYLPGGVASGMSRR